MPTGQEMVMSDVLELVLHIHKLAYSHPCLVSKGNTLQEVLVRENELEVIIIKPSR